MSEKCVGCGATIQTNNPNKPGYISKPVYEKRQDDFYCQRCFSLKHYNRNIDYEFDSNQYQKAIEDVRNGNGLIVYVIDLFNLDSTLFDNINQIYNSKNILIVANKVDLFLNSINLNKTDDYLRYYLKSKKINYVDLMLISSYKQKDIKELIYRINELRNNKNVYFVGMTNVGKSSLINQIIKVHTNIDNLITVSNMINTTLDNIYIPLDDNSFIVDTPGIINKNSITNFISKETLSKITPRIYIKPKTFQLNPNQTLFICGFVRIDFTKGVKSSFITNFSNDLLVHRTKYENADNFYKAHLDDVLQIPSKDDRNKLGSFTSTRLVTFNERNKIDIVIDGLGFITVFGVGEALVRTFENIKIVVRKAIL